MAQSPGFHTAYCSGKHFGRPGLALINSDLGYQSDSWQTDTQLYVVLAENMPFLLKHSALHELRTKGSFSFLEGEGS